MYKGNLKQAFVRLYLVQRILLKFEWNVTALGRIFLEL
jgi:hypothetical protein